jgi:hypothetical protein
MPPAPHTQSTHSTETETKGQHASQATVTTMSSSQHLGTVLHSLPSPPSSHPGHRSHRPSAREKRQSHSYIKQSTEASDDASEPHMPTSPRYLLRDGASAIVTNGEKLTILTPQERLSVSTTTPNKSTMKPGDLKPSPPSDTLHPIPDSPDSSFTGKGRFVRQNLLRQRSSINEDGQSPVTNTQDDETKASPRVTLFGGIQFGGYTQPIPPSKVHHPQYRPQSRGRIIGSESESERESAPPPRPSEVMAELQQLQENEAYHLEEEEDEDEDEDDREHQRMVHLKTVVNQLLDDEESLLIELQSQNTTLGQSFPSTRFPSADPLISNPLRGAKGGGQSATHTTLFPDPNPKNKISSMSSPGPASYSMTLSQRKEKDQKVLQSLANADSASFATVSLNGKPIASPHSQRGAHEENRTFFPGIC